MLQIDRRLALKGARVYKSTIILSKSTTVNFSQRKLYSTLNAIISSTPAFIQPSYLKRQQALSDVNLDTFDAWQMVNIIIFGIKSYAGNCRESCFPPKL